MKERGRNVHMRTLKFYSNEVYIMKDVLHEVRCLKSNEDMTLALAGQFKQLSHEPEKLSHEPESTAPASQRSWVRIPLSHLNFSGS